MNISIGSIVAGLIFGGVGFVAFVYGKKQALWKPMAIGIALMAYPFFVADTLWQFIVGGVLTLALFLWKE